MLKRGVFYFCTGLAVLLSIASWLQAKKGIECEVTQTQAEQSTVEAYEMKQLEVFADLNANVGAGIIFDNKGNMLVGRDEGLDMITPDVRLTPFCSFEMLPKGKNYYFNSPLIWDMVLDKENNIIAAAQDRILKITPDGQINTLIREDFSGFLGASGIELDKEGNMYITAGSKILRYTTDLKRSIYIDAGKIGYYSFFSLEFDPEYKNLYISDFETQTLLKYPINQNNIAGDPLVLITEPIKNDRPFGSPLNIICGKSGNVCVSLDGMNQLLKVDGAGNISKIRLSSSKFIANHIIAFGGKGFDEEAIYITTFDGEKVYKYKVGDKAAIK